MMSIGRRTHLIIIVGVILGAVGLSPTPVSAEELRTLDEITIEGEIAVPQVLFITARDQHRYSDGLHHRYLRSPLEIGRGTTLPIWLAVAVWRQLAAIPGVTIEVTPVTDPIVEDPTDEDTRAPAGATNPDIESSDGPHQTKKQQDG